MKKLPLWIVALGIVSLCDIACAAINQPVNVERGLVAGIAPANTEGIQVFKGIPYAAPPTGDLRWHPPTAAASWTGVRQTDRFAPDCAAARPVQDSKVEKQSEDCLYLNIWTPAKTAADKLPVMVWIYGSGFLSGTSSAARFDGEGLAKKGVVLVSMNFRGGILGYMTHPLLSAESPQHASGNYGVLDGVAAIQWVKRNIAVFGGDPISSYWIDFARNGDPNGPGLPRWPSVQEDKIQIL